MIALTFLHFGRRRNYPQRPPYSWGTESSILNTNRSETTYAYLPLSEERKGPTGSDVSIVDTVIYLPELQMLVAYQHRIQNLKAFIRFK